ncbi:MAG TPA: outer membrane beta-barrel protein [Parafilimonas sp.]|nr:outer membrane beta-barrel protein [Parafilimonas sp.]
MRKILTLVFLVFLIEFAPAQVGNQPNQQASVKGTIVDTTNKKNLLNTTIALLHAKDSVLYKFTRSKEGGSFELDHLDSGRYILMITHNAYADYLDTFTLHLNETKDLGNVMMTLEANLLADVTVRTKIAAMRMKGDTLSYAADSFHVRQGASVEDLLKVLPGIQVDKSGNITAQGEKVQKVLVDGEEFFGDDPTVATQNLQADAVKEVQVFDKKSDQAEFSGIDDGQKTKTINLKLKDDKKKGYFGKLDVGAGTDERWNNSGMINDFKGKKKISAYGIMSSTGRTGLNWDEQNSYGESGGGLEFNDDFGGFMFFGNNDDEFANGSYYGQGVPKSWATGLNFGNKFNDDKQNLNGSYRFNKITSDGSGSTFAQSILPDSLFYNTESARTFNSRWRHSLSTLYEQQFDSSFSLKLTAKGYMGHLNTFSDYKSQSLDAAGAPVNQSLRNSNSEGDNSSLTANLILRKKFKKIGRTFSLNLNEVYNGSTTDGFLYSLNSFYDKTVLTNQDTTDQEKKKDSRVNMFNSKATWTEPVAKNVFAEFNASYRLSTSDAENLSYDRNLDGKYNLLNDTFSSHYNFDVTTLTGGLAFKYNGKKITAGLGSDVSTTNFNQTDIFKDTVFERNYTNFFPRANFVYKFNQTSRLFLSYNGRTEQPTITQISPLADNTNPLIIYIGNPGLNEQFIHNFNFNANSFKVLSQRGFYMYGNMTVTENAIVTNQVTDTNGITYFRYVNTNGNYNSWMGLNYFKKFAKLDADFNWGINFNASRYNNFVNGVKNKTDNYAPGVQFGFNKSKEKKYNVNYWANFNYNISKSSINQEQQTKYWTQSHNVDVTIYLPWKLEVNNQLQADLRQKTETFINNNNVFLWNGYIGRKFLKNDKGLLKLYAYDILDQNKGYDRQVNTNVVTERNYETLTQYFLLSFVWNFSKTAAGTPANQP